MNPEEQTTEEIGTLENGVFTPNAPLEPEIPLEEEEIVEEPEIPLETPPISPEMPSKEVLQDMGSKIAQYAITLLEPEYKAKVDAIDGELTAEKIAHEINVKSFQEKEKKTKAEMGKREKDTETKHKKIMEGKESEIGALKKQLEENTKALAELKAQVIEALQDDE